MKNLSSKMMLLLSYLLVADGNMSSLRRLFKDLFNEDNYDKMVRPFGVSDITEVKTELKLLQIDLDEKYQQLVSVVWLEMTWNDERIRWSPIDYSGIKEITLEGDKIWLPDIVLQNGVGVNDYINEFRQFNPWILHTGLVTWVPEVRLHTKCVISVADFPFDTQCCEINFYSWAHTAAQMSILQYDNKNVTNLTHLTTSTEWHIYNTCAINKTITTSQGLEWWVTSYVLKLKRESIYHFYTLLMPCGVLSVLSILMFWLPPDAEEKITLGLIVSNYTPESASELPVIGVYYMVNIILVALSLIGTVFILKLHFRGHKMNRVPRLIRRIFKIENLGDLRLERANLLSRRPSLDRGNYSRVKSAFYCKTSNETSCYQIFYTARSCKYLKNISSKMDEEKVNKDFQNLIVIEWKEVARRVESLFTCIAFIGVVMPPFILFHKYSFRDIAHDLTLVKKCGCDPSFT